MPKKYINPCNEKIIGPKVCLVYFPWASKVPYKFISEILEILEPISHSILLIGGNVDRLTYLPSNLKVFNINIGMHYQKDIKPRNYSILLWVIKCVFVQVKTSFALFNERKNYDKVVFYMAHPYHFMPLVFTSLLKKKSLEVITWSTPTSKSFFSILFELQDRITFRILDGISPESKNLISNLKLEKYGNKVLSEGARFVNRSLKDSIIEYNSRDNIVGYIGRIRKEKGIVDFMKAIPLILEKNKDVKFLIVGDGDLIHWVKKEARNIIEEYNVEINVTGWIPEDKFAHYLCQLKLLVLPTNHAEGLPTIILESMFVEVPVLTTSVGAIPDVIIDECTGFFLQDTSPECIANGVMRALNNPKSDTIIHNARNLVENKYAYDAAVERFRLLINC